jgi:hypothetical protein
MKTEHCNFFDVDDFSKAMLRCANFRRRAWMGVWDERALSER